VGRKLSIGKENVKSIPYPVKLEAAMLEAGTGSEAVAKRVGRMPKTTALLLLPLLFST
jgi:hypothetical protein